MTLISKQRRRAEEIQDKSKSPNMKYKILWKMNNLHEARQNGGQQGSSYDLLSTALIREKFKF